MSTLTFEDLEFLTESKLIFDLDDKEKVHLTDERGTARSNKVVWALNMTFQITSPGPVTRVVDWKGQVLYEFSPVVMTIGDTLNFTIKVN